MVIDSEKRELKEALDLDNLTPISNGTNQWENGDTQNSVVNVVKGHILYNKYNKYNKYNNTTNTTITYYDIFKKDTQPNRIKWRLYVLSSIKKDFSGLTNKEICEIIGTKNMGHGEEITRRLKKLDEIMVYNKLYNKTTTKCYILSESSFNSITETIESIMEGRIEELRKSTIRQKEIEKLGDIATSFKGLFENKEEKVYSILDDRILINFEKLSEFNPDMGDLLLDNPEKIIDLVKNIFEDFGIKDKTIQITHLPISTKQELSRIGTKNLNKLSYFEVEIITATEITPSVKLFTFECKSCGSMWTASSEQISLRCSCGRFMKLSEGTPEFRDYRILLCSDNKETIDDLGTLTEKRIHLSDNLAKLNGTFFIPASKLRIVGIPFIYYFRKQPHIDIKAISIEPIDELLVLNFDNEEIKKFKEFSKQNPLETIKKEVYDISISEFDDVKKSLILQIVGGVSKKQSNGVYKRGEIHNLLVGDPATGKSLLSGITKTLSIKSKSIDSNRVTSAGLTGTFAVVEQLGKSYQVAGAFDDAKGGLLVYEEMNEGDPSLQATLKTPLESSEYSISLATGQTTRFCPFSFLTTMNPLKGNLDLTKPILQQIPLNPALKTRFDFIWGGFIKSQDKKVIDSILEKQDLIKNIDREKHRFYKKYLTYCKLQHTTIPKNIQKLINDFCSRIIINSDATFRIKDTLVRIIESYAKINLRDEANKQDFENAKKLFLSSLQSTSLDKEKYDYSRFVEVSFEEIEDMDLVEEAYNQIKDDRGICSSLNLLKKTQLESNRFNHALSLLFSKHIIPSALITEKVEE